MSIPTYDQLIDPLLRALAEHPEGMRTTEAYEAVATKVRLTEGERAQMLPSKIQPVYHNRIGWAHNRLKHAELSSSLRRGLWQLTENGRAYAAAHPGPLTPAEIEALARVEPGERMSVSRTRPTVGG
ncbi:MAG TPA: winged helix-turn-helix domain-containing protein [Polyangia bacterium]|jgi:restriction system protein